MFLARGNKLHTLFSCHHSFGTRGGLGLLTGVSVSPRAPGEERRDLTEVISLRNTTQAKICSLPKLTENFSPIFLSAALFLPILSLYGWMNKSTMSWAAAACKCFSSVLLKYTALPQTRLRDAENCGPHRFNASSLPCRGSW